MGCFLRFTRLSPSSSSSSSSVFGLANRPDNLRDHPRGCDSHSVSRWSYVPDLYGCSLFKKKRKQNKTNNKEKIFLKKCAKDHSHVYELYQYWLCSFISKKKKKKKNTIQGNWVISCVWALIPKSQNNRKLMVDLVLVLCYFFLKSPLVVYSPPPPSLSLSLSLSPLSSLSLSPPPPPQINNISKQLQN